MGRPKKPKDEARTAWLQMRCTPAFRDWLATLAELAGHSDSASLIEHLAIKEGKRLKAPPAPPR